MKKYNISTYSILIVLSGSIFIAGCKKNDNAPDQNNTASHGTAMTARDSAVQNYNNDYLGSNIGNAGWTGNSATCNAGAVPQSTNDAVINRINYFRHLVGVNDNCTLDASLFAQEQQTALMMKANYALNHNPPATWSCYTSTGA